MYSAPWCAICTRVRPRLEAAASRHADVDFGVRDVTKSGAPDGVHGVPTLVAITANGVVAGRHTGEPTEARFDRLVAAARGEDTAMGGLDPMTRTLRTGSGAALTLIGWLASSPLLYLLGAGFLIWGSYDLLARD